MSKRPRARALGRADSEPGFASDLAIGAENAPSLPVTQSLRVFSVLVSILRA